MAPGSALLGQPPANDDDYTIIQAVLVSIGLVGKLPPEKGLHFPGPPRPPPDQYHFETTAPKILVGAAIGSFLIITVTAARLVVRGRNAKLRYGWDDVFITIGAVRLLKQFSCGIGPHTHLKLIVHCTHQSCSVYCNGRCWRLGKTYV